MTIKKFDVFRKERNVSDYERADTVSEREMKEMRALAEKLRQDFDTWIAKTHPEFKP